MSDDERRRQAEIDSAETRRRARIRRTHGHAATPYLEPGCARCRERVVVRRGTVTQ